MAELEEADSSVSSSGFSSFDVFLSFRGEDTRNNFTGFLHKALKDRGITVFIDSNKLWNGENIVEALPIAIRGSKISIPVFSKNYASSKWCLEELSVILDCHRSDGQIVLPIFFDVEPSHVRHQTESFHKPFLEYKKNLKRSIVDRWREALTEVGNIKGWVLKEDVNGDQAELVELVVKRVLDELIGDIHLAECKYHIGKDSHVNDLLSLLKKGSKNDVQFVGICGFGGIGKTTIAKAVYNKICSEFNGCSFLSDVREQATQFMGLVSLQKRLLKDMLKSDFDISDYHRGKRLIENRLCKRKVLLVLDDVDSQEQVDALAGEYNWFGQGSRIIITTRDVHILNVAKVDKDKIYWPQELDQKESLKLFSLHAFSTNKPPEDYMQLSHDVVCYSGGLPLTLEVLGCYLSDMKSKKEWESTLQKLKEIPHEKVQRRLKISYDNLKDDYQKAIFLDIACFFIGWEKETVISISEACGYYPESAIHNLMKRSLLKLQKIQNVNFVEYNRNVKYVLKMHDQIRDMGREIVREESLMEPGKHSRLWSYGDILEVLEGHKGTDMIKGMSLCHALTSITLSSEPFQRMSNLRFLDISSASFMGDFSHLPSTLKCFTWRSCPWRIIPTSFYHNRLVYLDLSKSKIEQAWNVRPEYESKRFEKLKVLNLSCCPFLSKSPDFSWFPYLERLDLGYCSSLYKLDQSIGQLSQLKHLILQCCHSLRKLPDGIGLLEKLEILDAYKCFNLVRLPRSMRRMRGMHSINLEETIRMSKIPDDFSMLSNLMELKVSGKLQSLPADLSNLKNLKQLKLLLCKNLEYLPELPSSLEELFCYQCYSLSQLSDMSNLKYLRILSLEGCIKLEEIWGLEGTESLEELDARGCYKLTYTPRMRHGQVPLLPYKSRKNRYSLIANDGMYYTGLILCLVLEFPNYLMDKRESEQGQRQTIYCDISASICQKRKTIKCRHTLRIEDIEFTAHQGIIYIHHFKGFDWFGIPLQGRNAIENLDICGHPFSEGPCYLLGREDYIVKFWEVLFENGEPAWQKPNQHLSAMMVEDVLPYIVIDGGLPSHSLSLTCWSRTETEESNSVPKEKEEEEGVTAWNNKGACLDDKASCPSLSLALTLPCVALTLDDGSNQQTLDQPSHVPENGKMSPSGNIEEEEEEEQRNNTTADFFSCLGFDSVSEVVGQEKVMLSPSKRAHLHDDEASDPSLSLTLSTPCKMNLCNGFNLQQMLSQQPNIDNDVEGFPSDTEEVERSNRIIDFIGTTSYLRVRGSNNVPEEVEGSDEMIDSHSVLQMICSNPLIKKAMLRAGKRACHDEDAKQVSPSRVEESELRAIERLILDEDEVSPSRVEEALLRATETPILDKDDEAACPSPVEEMGLSRADGIFIFDNMDETVLEAIGRIVLENEEEEGVLMAMERLSLDKDDETALDSGAYDC